MSSTGTIKDTKPAWARLDRPVLVSNISSGALWLVLMAFMSPLLSVIGAPYIAAASVFLAAVHARPLTKGQEALCWAVPWLVGITLWTGLFASIEDGTSSGLLPLWGGLAIATLCHLAWQLVALAFRHLLGLRASARPY